MHKLYPYLIFLSALLAGCSPAPRKYQIGVSQCSADIWRDKQNQELRMGAYFHDNVNLRFAAAYDSDERQVQQIDSLVGEGIDLLIVAPNQIATISPAIDRAYDKGIPVIVFERKTNSQKFTAFMGADNYEMGRLMGEYIVSRLNGRGRVMEVKGLEGSSPAIERHKGLLDALGGESGLQVVASLQGDWTEPTAYRSVKEWIAAHPGEQVDLVFGMNDRSAMGARQAFIDARRPLPLFCGIDGLPGQQGGIRLVRDSLLDASYIYPTRGELLLQLALDILEGRPYQKETRLMSAIVTPDNARVLLMESDEVMRQASNIEQLQHMASGYLRQLDSQRAVTLLALALAVLLLLLAAAMWLYHRQRVRMAHERGRLERLQLDFYTQVSHELRTPLTLIEGPLAQLAETAEMKQATPATAAVFDIVRRNARQLSLLVSKMLDGTPAQPAQTPAESASEPCPPAVPAAQPAADGATLLIVDDNADIRLYLRTILQDRYQILEAADGQQGLETARREVPDLIVSDVMMPVMNGLEFCQRVKENVVTSHIPVILLTARALSRHQAEGYRSGADVYLTKPFQPDVLTACIDNQLRCRKVLRDLWQAAPQPSADTDDEGAAAAAAADGPDDAAESPFIARFKAVVEAHLTDSDLSVETIGAELSMSRVQLYRKLKALTGQSPVELLRRARLARARHLLTTTDLTVSEVAYQSGFSAPSYFTKCFKEEYGQLPGDIRQKQ